MAGGLDDLLNKALPGGSFSKPLMIALGTLLVGKMVSGGFGGAGAASGASAGTASRPQADPTLVPQSGADAGAPGGLGGIGDLLRRLSDAGHDDKVDSWVGHWTERADRAAPGRHGAGSEDGQRCRQAVGHERTGFVESAGASLARCHQSTDTQRTASDHAGAQHHPHARIANNGTMRRGASARVACRRLKHEQNRTGASR